jgi:hypothetical protein
VIGNRGHRPRGIARICRPRQLFFKLHHTQLL